MSARALWKGTVKLPDSMVPVKLYAAAQDKTIHFRLLHEKDNIPIKQVMVNAEADQIVEKDDIKRGYVTEDGKMVVLDKEDLADLEPDPSRDIEIIQFMPRNRLDRRWYDRPYYLGPDEDQALYFALSGALKRSGTEGLVRWVMRNKEYYGALRVNDNYLMLITLRHKEEIVFLSELRPPESSDISDKEIKMAEQLLSALEEEFDPSQYHSDYRERVMDMIHTKARGEKPKIRKFEPGKQEQDLKKALEASLKNMKERKRA